jgi:AGCS family alanine or glycine:cation symporter
MFNGLMVLPNLIALIGLAKVVSRALDDFESDGTLKTK